MNRNSITATAMLLIVAVLGTPTFAQQLDVLLDQLLADGKIVGAQATVAERNRTLLEHCVGTVSVESVRKVDADTLFCIGSCSKPFASSVVMVLVDERVVALDGPIDEHLPEFSALDVVSGEPAERAPTLRELLCHRAGIFSQKRHLTPAQRRLIRDFRLTLKQSVDGIARQKLIARPGDEYAYSGAGYCVIGRLAEVVTGEPFERVFQRRLAEPLGLKRTTYFSSADDTNIAAGAVLDEQRLRTDRQTPHLFGAELRLPLIGGSLYSTARETTRFARMIAGRGRVDSKLVISNRSWEELTSQQAGQRYGLGWSLALRDDRTVRLSHNGSLASSRSALRVDLDTGRSVVVHYTVASPKDRRTGTAINQAVEGALERDYAIPHTIGRSPVSTPPTESGYAVLPFSGRATRSF